MIKNFKDCPATPEHKKDYNRELFNIVAPKYDKITKILSCNRDVLWKRYLIKAIPAKEYQLCVDVACGTGDLAFALARRFPAAQVHGIDVTPAMLEYAQVKNNYPNVQFMLQDMNHLAYQNQSVDLITGGYALRNAPDLSIALKEFARILRPGGITAFLDFSKSSSRMSQKIVYYLLKTWGSLWGILLHGNPAVYGYIAESLAQYPDRQKLYQMLDDAGFDVIEKRRFFLGIIEQIICKKRAS